MERTGAIDRHGRPLEESPASLRPADVNGRRGTIAAELAGEGFGLSRIPTRNGQGRAPLRQSASHLRAENPIAAEKDDAPQGDLPMDSSA